MQTTVIARIDLAGLRDNLGLVRRLCPSSRIMAVVKADAYGHGLLPVARALAGADGLAVARLHEALALREAGVAQRILLLPTLLDAADLGVCSQLQIDVTAHDSTAVTTIIEQAYRTPLRVWLKLDSGMHRTGLDPAAFVEADAVLSRHSGIPELVHMTHFSSAEHSVPTMLEAQLACLRRCLKASSRRRVSLANSAALISRPDTHTDWVRPGIMLYGVNPIVAGRKLPLQAIMRLTARVIAIRNIDVGESVGYGGRWTSTQPSRIGTIGIGYGDGYPRHASNGTPVWVGGKRVPLVGQVSMDSLSVDLTQCRDVRVGDEAVLWGPELPAEVIAEYSNTIPYELFTSVQRRVTREYVNSP